MFSNDIFGGDNVLGEKALAGSGFRLMGGEVAFNGRLGEALARDGTDGRSFGGGGGGEEN